MLYPNVSHSCALPVHFPTMKLLLFHNIGPSVDVLFKKNKKAQTAFSISEATTFVTCDLCNFIVILSFVMLKMMMWLGLFIIPHINVRIWLDRLGPTDVSDMKFKYNFQHYSSIEKSRWKLKCFVCVFLLCLWYILFMCEIFSQHSSQISMFSLWGLKNIVNNPDWL